MTVNVERVKGGGDRELMNWCVKAVRRRPPGPKSMLMLWLPGRGCATPGIGRCFEPPVSRRSSGMGSAGCVRMSCQLLAGALPFSDHHPKLQSTFPGHSMEVFGPPRPRQVGLFASGLLGTHGESLGPTSGDVYRWATNQAVAGRGF